LDPEAIVRNLQRRGMLAVAERVARSCKVPLLLILGRTMPRSITRARKALYRALSTERLSSREIAFLLGRDPVTVSQGLRT
jgi:hypothetical protein